MAGRRPVDCRGGRTGDRQSHNGEEVVHIRDGTCQRGRGGRGGARGRGRGGGRAGGGAGGGARAEGRGVVNHADHMEDIEYMEDDQNEDNVVCGDDGAGHGGGGGRRGGLRGGRAGGRGVVNHADHMEDIEYMEEDQNEDNVVCGDDGAGQGGGGGRRGGLRGGRAGGRGRAEHNGNVNEDHVVDDTVDNDVKENEEELADIILRRGRGYSAGRFGDFSTPPTMVRIEKDEIDSGPSHRTLLALMRVHWFEGAHSRTDVDRMRPRWWDDVADEFFKYYTFDPNYANEAQARESVINSMRENLRKTMNKEKSRADKLIKKKGGKYEDYKPFYFDDAIWNKFSIWWRSDQFGRRSAAGRGARGKVKVPHTSGARSFEGRRRDHFKKHKKFPELVEHYKDTHELRTKPGVMVTKEAQAILDRYIKLCTEMGVDPNTTHIKIWLEAINGPRKDKIVGFPSLRASEVLGTQTRPARRIGEGGSGRSTMERIRDDLFLRAVDRTISRAQEHPEEFSLSPDDVRVLARGLLDGDAQLPPDHPLTEQTQQELIRVIIEVLNDMYKRNGPGNKGKAIDDGRDGHEDVHDDDGNDDANAGGSRPPRAQGGPVIGN